MAYLNEQERDDLLDQLTKMQFNQAKRKLRRMDRQARLAMFRNVQTAGEWITQYILEGLGTKVTLIENRVSGYEGDASQRDAAEYELVRVVVEPTPGNRT